MEKDCNYILHENHAQGVNSSTRQVGWSSSPLDPNAIKERTQIKAEGIENSTKIEKTVENERKKDESQKITETEKRLDR